jgi:hypothetical protein
MMISDELVQLLSCFKKVIWRTQYSVKFDFKEGRAHEKEAMEFTDELEKLGFRVEWTNTSGGDINVHFSC